MVSIQVLATPIRGLLKSASVKPMALNIERAPARSRPSVIPRLICLRSMNRSLQEAMSYEHERRANNRCSLIAHSSWLAKTGNPRCRFPKMHDVCPGDRHACPATQSRFTPAPLREPPRAKRLPADAEPTWTPAPLPNAHASRLRSNTIHDKADPAAWGSHPAPA